MCTTHADHIYLKVLGFYQRVRHVEIPQRQIPRRCESRSPRTGCGLYKNDLGTGRRLPRGLLTSRLPFRLPREGKSTMTTAFRVSSQPISSADIPSSLSEFLSVRRRLFGIAYRMLGSAAEAEDIVQDVWVRWQTMDRSIVRDAAAFLVTTATRLAINVMQSARSRRETYVGPELPEPVDTQRRPSVVR